VKYSKSQPPRVNAKARSSVEILMKSKSDEVAIINIVEAQVEELYFIFNLEYRLSLYQEGYHIDCQQSLNVQHSLKHQVR
jgi:homoserine trans-succinylase